MKNSFLTILGIAIFFSCSTKDSQKNKWKNEIIETERAFAEMALKEGITKAFVAFAATEAVLMRNNNLIVGKEAIQAKYSKLFSDTAREELTWQPDFVDVSLSGDLAYTYGKYIYSTIDSLGIQQRSEGIFHTVWKRQSDGKWKFVWD